MARIEDLDVPSSSPTESGSSLSEDDCSADTDLVFEAPTNDEERAGGDDEDEETGNRRPRRLPAGRRGSFLPTKDAGNRDNRDIPEDSYHSQFTQYSILEETSAGDPPMDIDVMSSESNGYAPPQLSRSMMVSRPSNHDLMAIQDLRRSLTSTKDPIHRVSTLNSISSTFTTTSQKSSQKGSPAAENEEDVEEDVDPHTKAFREAIKNACHDAFGILGVDVWLHSEEDGSFHHAPSGYYRHSGYRPTDDIMRMDALERVEDTERPDFVPPTKQIPGAGLAGYFWSQCTPHDRHNTWRDLAAIIDDPDQPPYLRMKMLAQAGYGKACGVPFDIRGHRGVVLFFAREHADPAQLTQLANDVHLRVSADLIGAISASSIASEAAVDAKRTRTAVTLRRVKAKLISILVFSKWFKETTSSNDVELTERGDQSSRKKTRRKPKKPSWARSVTEDFLRKSYRQSFAQKCNDAVKRKTHLVYEKSKGGNMQPPPPMHWGQSVWVFAGAFSTLLILSALSSKLEDETGYSLVLAPFGALMTLQYGLTPAPASQPRNVVYGQTISLSIALIMNLIVPATTWVRVPLTTALAIATMCKMGITHPPAGAAAAVFASSDRHDGVFFALMLLGNLIAIATAIFINNLNDKKQYPIYYAFLGEALRGRVANALEGIVPCLKRQKTKREEQKQDELDMSFRVSLRELNNRSRQRSFRQ